MKNFFSVAIVLVLLTTSCGQDKSSESYKSYGEPVAIEKVVGINSLVGLTETDTLSLKMTATVDEVCQAKGCWMTLKNENGEPIRVTFKDYGFFVPKDIAGREVIVEGVVSKSILEPDVAAHYAADAGTEYDSTKTYIEYAFLADGVLVKDQE